MPLFASNDELEDYYKTTLKPFLSLAYQYQDIPLTLFFSGHLLAWLQQKHSEYVTALAEMVKRKQVEILGGGYYCPILPLIPPTDRIGQVEELTTLVRKLLGKRPRGLWLTKGIWDPSLVVHLAGSGIEYTFLEEADFARVGIPADQMDLPQLTEHQGRLLTVFPMNYRHAQNLQNGQWDHLFHEMDRRSQKNSSLFSLFLSIESSDCGNFFKKGEKSLEAFLLILRSMYPQIEVTTPSAYLKKNQQALQRSYFLGTTYADLCQRADQPASATTEFQSWKEFLNVDAAANRLYNKMMYVNLLVSALRGDRYKKKSAFDDLWKAQTAWAYLPQAGAEATSIHTYRKKAFQALLSAEFLLRDKSQFQAALTSQDFDLDGVKEYLFQGKDFNFYVDPVGGSVFEWDSFEKPWNYVESSIRPSSPDIPEKAIFVDRFFRIDQPQVDAASFYRHEYRLTELNREQKSFQLMALDDLQGIQGLQPLRLKKTYTFTDNSIVLDYELELLSGPSWEGWFACESWIHWSQPQVVDWKVNGTEAISDGVTFYDPSRHLTHLWSWSYKAGVQYEAGHLVPRWWMILHPGEIWRCQISLLLKAKG